MREMKFRAWAVASREMFYPEWGLDLGVLKPLPNTILMQYTELKDENGKEIYEGDILNWKGMCLADYLWQKDDLIKVVDDIEVCYGGGQEWLLSNTDECRIIGNIHENPELLETK